MRFFRRRSNPIFLALLAIAMQLGLGLAQTHTHSGAASQRAWAKSVVASFCQAAKKPSCPAPAPAKDRSDCPICQAVSLASLSVLQAPPALPPTPSRMAMPRAQRVVASLRGAETVHFQARAPPIS
jgi:hypothetical protein